MEQSEIKPFCFETIYTFSELLEYFDGFYNHIEERKLDLYINIQRTPGLEKTFWGITKSQRFEQFWPSILTYSFITMLFSFTEVSLEETRDILSERDRLNTQASDSKVKANQDKIKQCMDYLDKYFHIKRDDIPQWPEIVALHKIRNCIVHASGRIEKSSDRKYLKDLLQKYSKEITLTNNLVLEERQIVLDFDYCRRLCISTRHFFESVFRKTNMADIEWPMKLA